jgi:hypothetical protein
MTSIRFYGHGRMIFMTDVHVVKITYKLKTERDRTFRKGKIISRVSVINVRHAWQATGILDGCHT